MTGAVRASLLIGAAARLSLLLEMHTRTVPNAPKIMADLRNKVANVSGLNSTDVSVEILPDNFFFPCTELLPSYEPESATATVARQLHVGHGLHFLQGARDRGMTLTLNSDDESEANSYYYYDEEPNPERGPRAETCAKCLAVGKDYCIANNRCTERATRTCEGAEDHVTGSPEFARTSPGHSMTCPGSEAGDRHGFLTHHGRKGFPVLLEVRGVTEISKLLQ